jgi:hypothetical protein
MLFKVKAHWQTSSGEQTDSLTMLIMRKAAANSCFKPASGNIKSYTRGDFESDGPADQEQ